MAVRSFRSAKLTNKLILNNSTFKLLDCKGAEGKMVQQAEGKMEQLAADTKVQEGRLEQQRVQEDRLGLLWQEDRELLRMGEGLHQVVPLGGKALLLALVGMELLHILAEWEELQGQVVANWGQVESEDTSCCQVEGDKQGQPLEGRQGHCLHRGLGCS